MNIKSKVKKILCMILIVISLLAVSTGIVSAAHIYQPPRAIDGANVEGGPYKGEIFKEYQSELNQWSEVPVWLFAQWNRSFWCVQHGTPIRSYLTATEPHYWAWLDKKPDGVAAYSEGNPYAFYRRTPTMGLITDHHDKLAIFEAELAAQTDGGYEAVYDFDDQPLIDINDATCPGIGKDPVYSIEWNYDYNLVNKDNQDALFAITQQKVYKTADDVPENEVLSEFEKKNGYFTVREKQIALWRLPINLEVFRGLAPKAGEDDRNLGNIAIKYQEFYNRIHNSAGEDRYEDIIKAYNVDKDSNYVKPVATDIEEKRTVIDGEDLKMYEYKDTGVEVEIRDQCYILGPYCIEYAADEQSKDIYYAESGSIRDCEVKFNAIENITIYNQDKIDITKLGGYFKIAYKYPFQDRYDEGKTLRINDSYYYQMADGKEISGFTSKDPFYIIVYRGSMQPEQFQGMYAKIDFQYLESIDGTIDAYRGDVYKYYYTKYPGEQFKYNFYGWYEKWTWVPNGGTWVNGTFFPSYRRELRKYDAAKSEKNVDTYIYELHRSGPIGEAQRLIAYAHDGWRNYKKYSIVIHSDWKIPTPPDIQIEKICPKCGPLYGAVFNVELQFNGKDAQTNKPINKNLYFTRVTGTDGLATITSDNIESAGVYLPTYSGYIYGYISEAQAPGGHKKIEGTKLFMMRLEKGKIVMCSGEYMQLVQNKYDPEKQTARITIYNEDLPPIIQIAKVDEGAGLVKEAYFDIHVSYTNPNGVIYQNGQIIRYGELIDREYNVIRGQTQNGLLNLSIEDFKNMPLGFDMTNYTGKLTLDIVEVRAGSGYSVSPSSKDITLEYINGQLVNYSQYTDVKVLSHYLYDNPFAELYDWAKGNTSINNVSEPVRRYINSWISRQQRANPDMKYDDILGWLVDYLEGDSVNLSKRLEEWKYSTFTTNYNPYPGIVQITVEDAKGPDIEVPDIPPVKPNPFFMKVAGTVFLDESTSKESEVESNGKLDQGEMLLMGIEVTLYEENGNKAKLVEEDGDIRTNPTITDENGYYEFRGVDPFKKYYVEFKYNGMAYRTTSSNSAEYNSEEWAVTSKGSDLISSRNALESRYNTVSYDTKVYDYYELKGLYTEMAKNTLAYIQTNKAYPSDPYALIGAHPEDDEIKDKIAYMRSCEVKAYAGYNSIKEGIGSGAANGTYAHSSLGDRYMIDGATINYPDKEVIFAGTSTKKAYPGQLQIHLGLVERDKTDLSLVTDIVKTTVSENRYDTTYNYNKDLSSYHQYIFAEDYNYAKASNGVIPEDGIAYYTEDNVDLYVTYKITVRNDTSIPATPTQIVDYYNSRFSFDAGGYTTSKGNRIPGIVVYLNGNSIGGTVGNSGYRTKHNNTASGDFKALYINLGQGAMLSGPNDKLEIELTFKLTDRNGHGTEVLKEMLLQQDGESKYSKSWEILNYAEITAYSTQGGFIDRDSHPGNFSINEFEGLLKAYREAYAAYVWEPTEDNSRKVKLALGRLTDHREDDAWKVELILSNNGYERELTGNVWEAISDEVKSSLDLQKGYGDRILTYDSNGNLALGGIKVELVELLKGDDLENGANQIVRARTVTQKDGSYKFKNYIAGDYAVRFIYGDYENTDQTIYSKVSTNTYDPKEEADKLPINGQYYQSTKANPDTNNKKYWYEEKAFNEGALTISGVANARYSDAYDDAFSRLSQMKSDIARSENSTSSEYEFDGAIEVETTRHTDPIYAYTSTMELEIEYIRPETTGNVKNSWYEYKVNQIDFGITPRAYNDLNIDKYVSNIKLYKPDGSNELIVDANFDENGVMTGSNIVTNELQNNTYLDGLINLYYNDELLQGAKLEITYKVRVLNQSLHDSSKKIYDTIKYIYLGDRIIGVVYYDEDTEKLVSYEKDELRNNADTIVYHNNMDGADYSRTVLTKESKGRSENTENRLRRYHLITGYNVGKAEIIKSRATNIVDYVGLPLDFTHSNKLGETVNRYWVDTNKNEFLSSREREMYKARNGNQLLTSYDHIIRATNDSPLYKELIPGEITEDNIMLSVILGGTASGASDYEYSNLVEITRMANDVGKIIDVEGYDINGKADPETSKVHHIGELDGANPKYTPTLATGKSATIIITVPAGLNLIENVVESNLGIVLVALVLLAGGLVLIKKYVIPSSKE